jgi:hypothetical protein
VLVRFAAGRYTASVIRTRFIAAAGVALAAACTMPGPAVAGTQPDKRAAAREFAYAAYRLRVRIKASEPAIQQVATNFETPACANPLGDDADELPKRAELGVGLGILELEIGADFAPVKGAYQQFITELDRVPTADGALIDGRNSWRSTVEFIAQTGPVPADLCDQLRRWRLAGYPANAIPAAQPEPIHRALLAAIAAGPSPSRSRPEPRRAARRMRELGVTAAQARRFTGETLYDGIDNGLVTFETTTTEVRKERG